MDFLDELAKKAFGSTFSEAHEKGICISCQKPPVCRNEEERREYDISGLCGPCWDEIFKDQDD